MNRREAIAALMGLPEIARISVAALQPSDVLVVESQDYLSAEQVRRIEATLGQAWPGRKVVVFDGGLRLTAARFR